MSESTQADNEESLKVWNQQSKTLYPAKTPFKINTFHSTAPVKHRRKGKRTDQAKCRPTQRSQTRLRKPGGSEGGGSFI